MDEIKKKPDVNENKVCIGKEDLTTCKAKAVWTTPSCSVTKLEKVNVLYYSFEGETDGGFDDNEFWGDIDLWG